MEGLEYLKELYKKAYEDGDERLCEHIIDALAKSGIVVEREDKLDVMNRMKGKSKRCVM